MMSGRGLGHTGGTLDKLEVDPRLSHRPVARRAAARRSQTIGCALIGQTSEIAPADRKLYALRDVTGTVESIPLISASIMSKKIAEGIGGLVLDVKTGDGAFMKTRRRRAAARRVAGRDRRAAGVRTEALMTSMDAPLGRAVGNALEIVESHRDAEGAAGPRDLEALSVDARGADAGRWRASSRIAARGGAAGSASALASRRRRSRSCARSSRTRVGIRASSTTTRACRRRPIATTFVRRATASSRRSRRSSSGAPPSSSAPAATGSTRRSIRRWG